MIIEERTDDGRIRHYSDSGVKIRQVETGNVYEDAVDNVAGLYSYEETDMPIDEYVTDADKAEAYDILMGVET